ncbi:helix-turn-helix transcriptional regulator [Deinococcus cellulosilyticus]|uniref:HTH cro/C1-type domain-containing protein n=1 Tax=Deinococcus cellulosilyticus (strain DSM 18568 / NBRC 106333 / KACC 11606 / 5516J-15) TaxID=1223518 RepID=A0A511NAR3_DEIC1|nr:hypothetical protein [Deinococcus cellulosilyticus]GEM49900.1 hypothetical protein DC3_55350 [Deinococcus cellulosilyticus NBRC 106333 = KACC 11606]
MQNPTDARHGPPVSIGQYLTLELTSRQQTLQGFTRQLGCPEDLLQHIMEGQRPLTADLALKIERCWGISMKLLLDLQHEHQQWSAASQTGPERDCSPEVG